jgi:hypothetical protein
MSKMDEYRRLAQETGLSLTTVRAKLKAGQPLTRLPRGPQSHTYAPGRRRERVCLLCLSKFSSWGAGNRRCDACEDKVACIRPADRLWIYAP